MEMAELIIALSWTFGLTTYFIGHLNLLSVTCAPLLLGLGIDYGIHWFARYQEEERLRGASTREGIQAAMVKLGPGIILAGFSASLSFFPLVLTGFRGLVELGIITSIGMIMTTITTLSVLPALTLLFDKPSSRTGKPDPSVGKKFFLKMNNKKAAAILSPALLVTVFSLWGARKVSFDLNMLRLQSQVAESVIWEKKLMDESDRSSIYGSVLARSPEEIREKTVLLEGLESVSEARSVESLLPEEQEEKIKFLRGMKPLLEGVGSFEAGGSSIDMVDLDRTLGKIRFKMLDSSSSQWGAGKPLDSQMMRVRELIDNLRARFAAMEPSGLDTGLHSFQENLFVDLNDKMDILQTNMSTRPMSYQDLPEPLLMRFAGEGLYLIRIFPVEDIWEPVHLERFVEELQEVEPDVIGDPVTLHIFTQAFRNACVKAAFYAVIFIFSVLMLTFRSPLYALLAMVPLGAGTTWTLGLMSLFNIDFNLANTIFLPLIVGAGVEYGIILMQRWRQEELGDGVMVLPLSTAKGIILAGLTTTVGFGSLTISAHRGIHSLGLLAILGSLSILAAAVLLLPSILHVLLQFSAGQRLHSRSRPAREPEPRKEQGGGNMAEN
jgi:predicted RND superfamily exporter protein